MKSTDLMRGMLITSWILSLGYPMLSEFNESPPVETIEIHEWNGEDSDLPPLRNTALERLSDYDAVYNLDERNCARTNCGNCVIGYKTQVLNNSLALNILAIVNKPRTKIGNYTYFDCESNTDNATCECENEQSCDGTPEYCSQQICTAK